MLNPNMKGWGAYELARRQYEQLQAEREATSGRAEPTWTMTHIHSFRLTRGDHQRAAMARCRSLHRPSQVVGLISFSPIRVGASRVEPLPTRWEGRSRDRREREMIKLCKPSRRSR
jgi:hypothetical protein